MHVKEVKITGLHFGKEGLENSYHNHFLLVTRSDMSMSLCLFCYRARVSFEDESASFLSCMDPLSEVQAISDDK